MQAGIPQSVQQHTYQGDYNNRQRGRRPSVPPLRGRRGLGKHCFRTDEPCHNTNDGDLRRRDVDEILLAGSTPYGKPHGHGRDREVRVQRPARGHETLGRRFQLRKPAEREQSGELWLGLEIQRLLRNVLQPERSDGTCIHTLRCSNGRRQRPGGKPLQRRQRKHPYSRRTAATSYLGHRIPVVGQSCNKHIARTKGKIHRKTSNPRMEQRHSAGSER